jgi:hypothetical protein
VSEAKLSSLQRDVHEQTRDERLDNPGWYVRWAALTGAPDDERNAEDKESIEQEMSEFLGHNGEELNEADRHRFLSLFAEALLG